MVRRRILKAIVSRDGATVWSGEIDAPEVTAGRSPSADLVLDDPQVSWIHARISWGKTGIVFTDCSTNGSFRNGEAVTTVNLGPGGVISIPPFEVDLSLESAVESGRARGARTSIRRAASERLASTVPDTDVSASGKSEGRSAAVTDRGAELRFIRGPRSVVGAVYPLVSKTNRIGRAIDCDVRLDLQGISRYHATLTPSGHERWRLCDTGSRNQVEVNGQVVNDAIVRFGDRINFGADVQAILTAVAPSASGHPQSDTNSGSQTSSEALLVTRTPSPIDPRVVVLGVNGRLDGYSCAELKDRMAQVIDEGHRGVVLDLSRCSFCDHVGLAVLVQAQVTLAGKKGGLRLVGLSAQLTDALLLLRLDDVLSLAADARTAALELAALLPPR